MPKNIQGFFSKQDQDRIIEAIKAAELNTSGEIRVHLEAKSKLDPIVRAQAIFTKLKMHKTQSRNGILFYLAVEDHKFAIIGDKGIHTVVGDEFWDRIKETVISNFKESRFTKGLVEGIQVAGHSLKQYFPYQSNDKNEHKDEISFE
jgi:uncharacterized membrane protein